jgi:FtsP/CotA-like multicopper oxidase with cupredoxin domain
LGRNRLLIAVLLLSTGCLAQRLQGGKLRTYYIAADDVTWDYTPGGRTLAGLPHFESSDEGVGKQHRVYPKAVYHEYTDGAFKTAKPRPPEWQHLGILGPLIRAEVGDTIKVFFKNNTKRFCTMHPHGLAYDKNSEGASYNDGTSGDDKADDAVPPGGSYTYTWTVPERAGPGPGDPSSILWMYHSHFNEPKDVNTGLIGPIIISARGSTKPMARPRTWTASSSPPSPSSMRPTVGISTPTRNGRAARCPCGCETRSSASSTPPIPSMACWKATCRA